MRFHTSTGVVEFSQQHTRAVGGERRLKPPPNAR